MELNTNRPRGFWRGLRQLLWKMLELRANRHHPTRKPPAR